jgi:hypothetical protein
MRTVIIMGCFAIADAIRADWFPKDENVIRVLVIFILLLMTMDTVEFLKNLSKKS